MEGQARSSRPIDARIIPDEPANVDFFNTHTEIAGAIETVIKNNPNAKVIGLFGSWGSGKSTVVKRVSDSLAQDAGHDVFTYDAWLHQGDPIRRSFLESLYGKLKKSKYVGTGSWDAKLADVSRSVSDSETTEMPRISIDLLIIGLSLIFVPLGASLVSLETLSQAFGETTTKAGVFSFWLGLGLLLAPVISWIVIYLFRRPWKTKLLGRNRNRDFWALKDSEGNPSSVLPLFVGRSPTHTRTRTLTRAEPTSLEFGRLFQDIMLEARKGGIHFVIIIDNLDRISNPKAAEIWATIRSFFLSASQSEVEGHHELYHPTVVLPIDQSKVRNIFKDGVHQSFIDKTFDIIFRVPDPVSSDWRAFLSRQLEFAFRGNCGEQDAYWIRWFFEESIAGSDNSITPREINKYVNKIVALYLQWWSYGIELKVLAFYEIYRDQIANGIVEFLNEYDSSIFRENPEWKNQIASLHFGVHPDKATQVLLGGKIRGSIVRADESLFRELSEFVGFREVVEGISADLPQPMKGQTPLDITINFAQLIRILDDDDDPHLVDVLWWRVNDRLASLIGRGAEVSKLNEALKALGERISDEHAARILFGVRSSAIEILNADETTVAKLREAAEALRFALKLSKNKGIEFKGVSLSGSTDHFLHTQAILADYPDVWPIISTSSSGSEIIDQLIQFMNSVDHQSKVVPILRILLLDEDGETYGGDDFIQWGPLITAADQVLRNIQNNGLDSAPAIGVFRSLISLDESANEHFDSVIKEIGIAHMVDALRIRGTEGGIDLLVCLIWRAEAVEISRDQVRALTNDVRLTSDKLVEKLPAFREASGARRLWKTWHRVPGLREVIYPLISQLIKDGTLGGIPSKEIFGNLYFYGRPLNSVERTEFERLLHSRDDFWEKLQDAPMTPVFLRTIKSLMESEAVNARELFKALEKKLNSVDASKWSEAIFDGSEPYKLLTEVMEPKGLRFGVRSQLYSALDASIERLLGGTDKASRYRWFDLLSALNPRAANGLLRRLSQSMVSASPGNALKVLTTGGPTLRKALLKALDDSQKDAFLYSLMGLKTGLDFLVDHAIEFAAWIRNLDSTNQKSRERLALKRQSTKASTKRAAERLWEEWRL